MFAFSHLSLKYFCMKAHIFRAENVLYESRAKALSNAFSLAAKTRMKMLTLVTAMKALPHTQLDNQQTAFDSVRLVTNTTQTITASI